MKNPLFTLEDLKEPAPIPSDNKFFESQPTSATDSYSVLLPNQLRSHYPCDQSKGVMFVNKGFWDMHDLLLLLLDISGPVHLTFSSYAISETAARVFAKLKSEKVLLSMRCVIDNRIDTRSAGSLQLLRSIADHITLCACHAKITLLHNADVHYTVVGSANYTENKRFEAGFISNSFSDFLFHKNWLDAAMQEYGQYNP